MSGYFLLGPAFAAGWFACWYFRLRPFARDVEEKALDIKRILGEIESRNER